MDMSLWMALVAGIVIGWLVEWIIDWTYWRRGAEAYYRMERDLRREVALARQEAARAQAAAQEYQEQLAAYTSRRESSASPTDLRGVSGNGGRTAGH
jgi:hypothetical protein